jgi:hypothetical protein
VTVLEVVEATVGHVVLAEEEEVVSAAHSDETRAGSRFCGENMASKTQLFKNTPPPPHGV